MQGRKKSVLSRMIAVALTTMVVSSTVYADEVKKDEKGTAQVTAQSSEQDEVAFDRVVVTAQRMETTELDTPASTTVITAEDIKNSGAKSVTDILDMELGFDNMSYGPSGTDFGASSGRIKVRGLDRGTLVMVNGAPMNLMTFNGAGNIPVESIEKIEIIKGSNSTLYGAEAMAGVINIITKKASKAEKTTLSVGAGNLHQTKYAIDHQGENFSVYYSNNHMGDNLSSLKSQSTEFYDKPYSSTPSHYALGKNTQENAFFTTQLTDQLTFNWAYSDNETNRLAFNIKTGSDVTNYIYYDKKNTYNLIFNDEDQNLKSTLAYNARSLKGTQTKVATGAVSPVAANYDMGRWTWDTQKGWDLANGKDTLIGGITLNRETYDCTNQSQSADRTSSALYASYTHPYNEQFSATLGMRGEFINDYAKDQNVFLPQLQTLYKVNDSTSWYTNIGKSFQMPWLSQYFQTSSNHIAANGLNDVKPQQGWTYETGLKIIDDTSAWKFAIFHMDIKDSFKWAGPTTDRYLTNVGNFKNTGVEVEYTKKVDNDWKYKLGATLSDPKDRENSGDAWEQAAARVQLTAGIEYTKEKLFTSLNYVYLADREDSIYDKNGGKSGAYDQTVPRSQLNAQIRYQADAYNSVELSLKNILNKDYPLNNYDNLDLPFNYMLTVNHTF